MEQETDKESNWTAEAPARKQTMLDRLMRRRDHIKNELEKLDKQIDILVKSPETRKFFELEN